MRKDGAAWTWTPRPGMTSERDSRTGMRVERSSGGAASRSSMTSHDPSSRHRVSDPGCQINSPGVAPHT